MFENREPILKADNVVMKVKRFEDIEVTCEQVKKVMKDELGLG